jgi:hypothetical protein
MMHKVLEVINKQIDKAQDFKYFAFFSVFVLFLDSFLYLMKNTTVFYFKASLDLKGVAIGEVLVFFLSLSFYMAVVVPSAKYFLLFINQLPYIRSINLTLETSHKDTDYEDKITIKEMKEFAVRNDNSKAYELALERERELNEDSQLRYSCLALVLMIILNFTLNDQGVINFIYDYIASVGSEIWKSILMLILISLSVFIFYLGVIIEGGFTSNNLNDRYFYFRNHNMRINSLVHP